LILKPSQNASLLMVKMSMHPFYMVE
jgi:hypothetical protein